MRKESQFLRSVRRYAVLLLALACKDHPTAPRQSDVPASGATTTITATPASLTAGGTSIIVVQAKDSTGANITAGGDVVVLSTDAGTLSGVTDAGIGLYAATITSTVARDVHLTGTINGNAIAHGATVTFVAGAAAVITKTAGDAQTGTVGASVAVAPAVTITDANGNPVAGVAVTFAVASGGGSVTNGTQTTNTSGIATLGGWTLGLTGGVNTLTVAANALTTTFAATGTAGAVDHFLVESAGGGAIPARVAGTSFAIQITALDANGNTATSFTGSAVVTSTGALTGAPITTAAFVNGVLASQAATITNTGSFTLTATRAGGAEAGSSAAFTVAAGGVTHFAVAAAGGGAIPPQVAGTPFNVRVMALDANGNTATSFASTAVLTSTGTLAGAPLTTAAFANGVLASQAVTITNAGSFTLTTTSSSPAATGTSAAFTVGGSAVTHFAVTAVGGGALPQQTAGTPFNVQIGALDANNNVAAFTGTVTLSSTGTLVGAPITTAAFTNGVLASQAVTITNSGSFTLTAASSSPIASGSSAAFTVSAGTVTHFAVTSIGGGTIPAQAAGTPFNVQLTALDANGNTATSFASTAVLTSTGTLTGAPLTTAAFANGVLASQSVTVTNTGSFALTATNGTATGSSGTFTVGGGAVTHFAVTAIGGGTIAQQVAGTPFNVQLTALDASNNTTSFTGTATLTSTGTLTGAPLTTAAFTNGVLASQAVTVTNTGSFTFTATRTGGTETGSSAAFSVAAGGVTHFAVTAVGGGAIPTQAAGTPFNVQVTALDANSNTANFTGTVIFTSTGTLTGAPLTTAAFVNGVLASQAVTVTNTGSFTLTATRTAGTETGTSGAFTVGGGAVTHFAVTAIGGGTIAQQVAGTPFNVQLTALDANNNTTSFSGTVALTSTGTLSGTPVTTVAFTNGVLASQSVTVTNTGNFTLTATRTGGTETGSTSAFTVVGGAVTHFAITAIGGGAITSQSAGAPFNVQIVALDVNNNTANFSSSAILTSTGTLIGAPITTAAFVNGVLAAQAVTITNSGSFTLTATNTTPAATGTSATFTVAPGAATHFAITAAGGGAIPAQTAGTPFNIRLVALDANNNTAAFTGTVALTSTGTLSGTPVTTAAFTNGVLASQAVTITNSGSFTLTATSSSPTASGSSAAFTVSAGAVTHFAVTSIGGGTIPAQTAGTPFNIQLTALDANGNTATAFASTTVLTSSGTLTGAPLTTAAFTNGVLASQSVTISNTGSFTLTATSSSPAAAGTSAAFTVGGGAVTHFAVTAIGGGALPQQTAGTPFNVQITALDANNNTANFSSSAIMTSTGTLTGAPVTTAAFTNGVLASQAVTITNTGNFTLTATSSTPSATGTSAAFTTVGGAVTHFAVTAIGGGAIPAQTAGTPFNIQLTALDANNNTTPFTGSVALTSTGTLSGTPVTTAAFTNGVLASQAVTVTNTGSFTLTATRTGGTETGTSGAFAVGGGTVTHFAVTAIGGGAIPAQTAGTPFNIQLTALDANGNTATSFASTAVITSTGTLTGAPVTTAAFTNGVLASQAVTVTNTGSFTLTATQIGGSGTGTSPAFVVHAGAPVTMQRSDSLVLHTVAGTPLSSYPAVRLFDVNGNPVPSSSGGSTTFSVISGSCSTPGGLTTTGSDGIAALSSSSLTLPSVAGSCLVRATSPSVGGSPIDFDVVVGPSTSVYTWLGTTSSDITSSSNWSGPSATPSGSTASIFIPASVPNSPNATSATTLGAATLEAGAGLTVSTNVLTLTGTVAAGTGSTITISSGAGVLFQGASTTLSNLTVNSGTASFSHNATVSGVLSTLNNAVVNHTTGGLTLTVSGSLTSSSATTLSGLSTVSFTGSTFPVYGNATNAGTPVVTQIAHDMSVPAGVASFVNNLTVSDAALSVNGNGTTLTVGSALDVKSSTGAAGELLMNSGDPTLVVMGTATFEGKAQDGQGLTAGTLDLRGDFIQRDRTTGGHGEFEPGPLPFVVKFTGSGNAQNVSFDHPGTSPLTQSYFTNVLVTNQGGVTQSTHAYINGGTMTVGGAPADAGTPAMWSTGIGSSNLFITGGGSLAVRQSGTFTVTSGGSLDLSGGSCTQYQAGLVSGNVVGGTCTVDSGLIGSIDNLFRTRIVGLR